MCFDYATQSAEKVSERKFLTHPNCAVISACNKPDNSLISEILCILLQHHVTELGGIVQ